MKILAALRNGALLLITWLGILIVFLLIAEVCFRVFRREANPLAEITQERQLTLFPPNEKKHLQSSIPGEFSHDARINTFGYRGEDFSRIKPEGTLRIFAVGDSFIFGVGAQDHETIPFLLEQKLKSRGLGVEVINAGIGNTSPIRHYINLRDIHLNYHPDLVVLFFDLTDLWDDWHFERNAVYNRQGDIVGFNPMFIDGKRDWWITCTYYSSFCRYINNRMVRTWKKIQVLGFKKYFQAVLQGKRAKALIATAQDKNSQEAAIEYDGLLMLRGKEKEALIRQHWARSAGYLAKIKDICAQHRIPMILIMYPHGIYVGGDQWSKGRLTWGFIEGKQYTDYFPFELVEDFARQENIPFINTLPNFLQAPKQKYFFDWDGHMMPNGNEIVADALVRSPVFQSILKGVTQN